MAMLATCPARAAETPISTEALGVARVRTHSRKFLIWGSVPSCLDFTSRMGLEGSAFAVARHFAVDRETAAP